MARNPFDIFGQEEDEERAGLGQIIETNDGRLHVFAHDTLSTDLERFQWRYNNGQDTSPNANVTTAQPLHSFSDAGEMKRALGHSLEPMRLAENGFTGIQSDAPSYQGSAFSLAPRGGMLERGEPEPVVRGVQAGSLSPAPSFGPARSLLGSFSTARPLRYPNDAGGNARQKQALSYANATTSTQPVPFSGLSKGYEPTPPIDIGGGIKIPPLFPNGIPDTQPLLDRISLGEGTSDADAKKYGFASGYDVPLAYGAYAKPERPLSQMTLAQVRALQTDMLKNPKNKNKSSAVGKYQITRLNLFGNENDPGLVGRLGLSDDDIFSPELQDQLAQELLARRGLYDYSEKRIDATEFQKRLAKEWTSIAQPETGKARPGQHLGTTTEEIQSVITKMRR